MPSEPLPTRKNPRLPGYDYRQHAGYFITICTGMRGQCLGRVDGDAFEPGLSGQIAERCWLGVPTRFPSVILDLYRLMPDHLHAILLLVAPDAAPQVPYPSLGEVVGFYKYQSTKQVNEARGTPGARFWQRSYYDHVIRTEKDLDAIRRYMHENPLAWDLERRAWLEARA